jgi:hypothetical protein
MLDIGRHDAAFTKGACLMPLISWPSPADGLSSPAHGPTRKHSCGGSNSHSAQVLKEKVPGSISQENFVAEKDTPSRTGSNGNGTEIALKT